MDILDLLSGEVSGHLANFSRYILPLVAVIILYRCIRSMLSERYDPETWAYLYLPGEVMIPLRHWECILGRSKRVDGLIDHPSVGKLHACLIRSASGTWRVFSLGRGNTTQVNGKTVGLTGLPIEDADVLTLGDMPARFVDLTEEERASLLQYRHKPGRLVRPIGTLFYLTIFQILLVLQQMTYNTDADTLSLVMAFGSVCALQWVYFFILRGSGQRGFEVEFLGFFLTTVGLSISASYSPSTLLTQVVFIFAAVIMYLALGIWMRDLKRMKALRLAAAVAALGLFGINMLFGVELNGARNWVSIGNFMFQPSEFVKVLYIYTGAATLDRLFVNRNLFFFIGFSATCVGALALLGDFGTALIFFVTFLVISFMRSGSFATVFLAIASAVLGVMLVITVKPYILARFDAWGHVWEDIYGTGYQQVRAMSAAASGGFFGQGSGNGWLIDVFAGESDMVFATVCEELGLITGLCCVLSLLVMALFVVKNASSGRSSYFVIAASAAISMMMVQMALNVFGTMDILPFTGVTFPFVSRGGSSLLCCWMLLAFIKGCDTRANASFAVKRPERFTGGIGVDDESGSLPETESLQGDSPQWVRDTPDPSHKGTSL